MSVSSWNVVLSVDSSSLCYLMLFYPELPDIVPDLDILQRDMKINHIPLQNLRCPMEENCLAESAERVTR